MLLADPSIALDLDVVKPHCICPDPAYRPGRILPRGSPDVTFYATAFHIVEEMSEQRQACYQTPQTPA